jgi:hypothetical protein
MRSNEQWRIFVGSILTLAALLGAGPASAQGTPQQRSACIGDAFRFCSGDIPNVARIEACLLQNRERLHTACQAQLMTPAPAGFSESTFDNNDDRSRAVSMVVRGLDAN